jgi:hypothetical protein
MYQREQVDARVHEHIFYATNAPEIRQLRSQPGFDMPACIVSLHLERELLATSRQSIDVPVLCARVDPQGRTFNPLL